MSGKIKEMYAKVVAEREEREKLERERVERELLAKKERLLAMTEKELLIEMIIELERAEKTCAAISSKCDDIKSTCDQVSVAMYLHSDKMI